MKYITEFRDRNIAEKLKENIASSINGLSLSIMEVCGTHTQAIFKHGIKDMLPKAINLLSGPGCPVCVTANSDLDKAIALANRDDVIITTFGDMMRVPASFSSLQEEKGKGASIKVVYSTLDALKIAEQEKDKEVVFIAVGFETTSPTIACSISEAKKRNIDNFSILCFHKLIPPAMKALLEDQEVKINGFLCPGHVSVIIGKKPYEFIAEDYKIPCTIAGFEPVDILESILMLTKQASREEAKVEIQYKRAVKPEGNPLALRVMNEVFEVSDAYWRGLGVIPQSGLKLRSEYAQFDAEVKFDIEVEESIEEPEGCSCGEILRGVLTPYDCPLFGTICTPQYPVGPCMVSNEGSCSVYYKYAGLNRR